jgi:hypothetical protein
MVIIEIVVAPGEVTDLSGGVAPRSGVILKKHGHEY